MDAHATGQGSPIATVNPYTGERVREFPALSAEDVERAIDAAHWSFPDWRARSTADRGALVQRAGRLMRERKEELAQLLTLEVGKLINSSRAEVDLASDILTYYGEHGPELLEERPLPVPGGTAVLVNEPLGVLLGVMPWNFPLYQVVRFAGPNLVLGNTILPKHASSCPQSALALEQLFTDAGVPTGVYTNLFVRGRDVGKIIDDSRVQGASLTGSERAGVSVGEIAGRNVKKSVLELGGSDPFIVLDGHNLDRTVYAAFLGRMGNTGQCCVAAKRFIALADVYDAFLTGLRDRMGEVQPGDPADPATTLGPLSSEAAAELLMEQVRDAVDKGATVVLGGGRPDLPGAVTPDMRAYREELFGPVAAVYRVADEDEAVALANTSPYGLGGAVFAADPERARGVADRLETGMVWINHPTASRPELPFGGISRSGYGRELGDVGIVEFANRKLVRYVDADAPIEEVLG
ncbi:NAD-dependent succinate-semialdehyde dehydrogenase [Streptomyces sp. NRRL B-3648]|uniref:NAD-dependent succinate-semialdehyde dehydrogenase n=1 Tax=Streptomyces sp. NRRL B-3648 TaxID=1519493 RepID=UPI00099D4D4B|nr:NAD-dependent succinate-semialdehyde dehydrogenase [Streptomyces sp. NRRL B-3648]